MLPSATGVDTVTSPDRHDQRFQPSAHQESITVDQFMDIREIAATLYHFLGINPFQDYHDREGRTFKVLDEGQVIRELAS